MNKSVKRMACLALAALTAAPFAACGGKQAHDPEKQPLVLSTDALDGKFNPFYATSATDVTIAAQTQISMLSLDDSGNIICGEDEPCVALDYKQTMYDANGNVTTNGELAAQEGGSTKYEFVIKNDIKYSDGDDLTIADVLFNLYVYLDPMYMGSATIYSTKIKGLNAYRMQNPDVGEDQNWSEVQNGFYNTADTRIRNLLGKYCGVKDTGYNENGDAAYQAVIDADFAKAKAMFKEELESDWNSVYGSLESYEEEYSFTEYWELYYFNEGLVTIQYDKSANGAYVERKKADGTYVTTLDEGHDNYSIGQTYIADMANALEGLDGYARTEAMRTLAIDTVFGSYVSSNFMEPQILMYWATGDKLREDIASAARNDYYENLKNQNENELLVKSISGIKHYNTKKKAFTGGKMGNKLDSKGHDVLEITIDGVDPKALHNFAFTVSPMHYYGSVETGAYAAKYKNYAVNNYNGVDHFGVAFGEKDFFDFVLQDPEKTGLPVGAGAYMATNRNDSGSVTSDNFFANNVVYFKRNDYFETVGDELNNANIKYLRYQVTSSDLLMEALAAGTVNYGTPNATPENVEKMDTDAYSHLWHKEYDTNGYGYVGINAKYVQDIRIRRVIMKTMDLYYPQDYYGSLSQSIYRSMSLESDYYPTYDTDGDGDADWKGTRISTPYGVDQDGNITDATANLMYYGDLLEELGNPGESQQAFMVRTINTYLDNIGWARNPSTGLRAHATYGTLEYVFTIAGQSEDHPAYSMFIESKKVLDQCGFKITVRQDIDALNKLASGELQVWAAAWSSAIDPDMYQVYHRDSTATSVKNWGYDEIFKTGNETKYASEIEIINEMSTYIEQGRQSLDPTVRFPIYAKALDCVMRLAVELPTYQRKDMVVFDATLIDASTLNQNPTSMSGPIDRIWEVNYL